MHPIILFIILGLHCGLKRGLYQSLYIKYIILVKYARRSYILMIWSIYIDFVIIRRHCRRVPYICRQQLCSYKFHIFNCKWACVAFTSLHHHAKCRASCNMHALRIKLNSMYILYVRRNTLTLSSVMENKKNKRAKMSEINSTV